MPLKASWCEEPQWLEEAVHELPLQSMVNGKGPVVQVPAGQGWGQSKDHGL